MIKPYDSSRQGAYYISKLASQSGFDYQVEKLDRLEYRGPHDLFTAAKENSYIPEHVKATDRYNSLVLRDPNTKLPISSIRKHSHSNVSSSDMVRCV
jgi:hypothetical protein